jgi:cold shock CspA family protein
MAKLKGTIKTIKRAEGFGFITHVSTGIDHFFHRSVVMDPATGKRSPDQFDSLVLNQNVEFNAEDGPKGARAIDVCVLE